jgi:hypothetical protein
MASRKSVKRPQQGKLVDSPPGDPLRYYQQNLVNGDPDAGYFYSYKQGAAASNPMKLMVLYFQLPKKDKQELLSTAEDLFLQHSNEVSEKRKRASSSKNKTTDNKENEPPRASKKRPLNQEEVNKMMMAAKRPRTEIPRELVLAPALIQTCQNAYEVMSQHDVEEIANYRPENSDLDEESVSDLGFMDNASTEQ